MPTLYTSLAEIKSFNPCLTGWKNILRGQGKTEVDDVLFPIVDALNSNSISDVCWLLGKRKSEIVICVRFAKLCADSVADLKKPSFNTITAAAAAAAAAYAASAANASASASSHQETINKQFFRQTVQEFEQGLIS